MALLEGAWTVVVSALSRFKAKNHVIWGNFSTLYNFSSNSAVLLSVEAIIHFSRASNL